ncbi:hypothetical protein R1sor_002460 [Riccia sorocarpa]|uniref:non-specific serine/threonine protein kinase n=1 Tax=Riccia sorocarpa TaxID=122646 RepID=A0ABD3GYV8_9MARC
MERRSPQGEPRFPVPKSILWSACFTYLVLSSLLVHVVSQKASDFISIDCGGTGFVDVATEIEWLPDKSFLSSVEVLTDKLVAVPATVALDDQTVKTLANGNLVKTAMVFRPRVDGIMPSKYCYGVGVKNITNYLVRVTFPTSNLTANDPSIDLSRYNKRFYFAVDATFIATIELDPVAPKTIELVVTPLDEKMHICFVPLEDRSSMPAVSTIELRPLPRDLYHDGRGAKSGGASLLNQPRVGNTDVLATSLITISRLNFGGNISEPPIRYPSDQHDRLWYPAGPRDTIKRTAFKTISTQLDDSFASSNSNWDYPVEVLQTAWEGVNPNVNVTFTFNLTDVRSLRPIPVFYISMVFFDVSGLGASQAVLLEEPDVGLEFMWEPQIQINSSEGVFAEFSWSYNALLQGDSQVFVISPNRTVGVPAQISGFEILGLFEAVTKRTVLDDGVTIADFASSLDRLDSFVDTSGDPCLPVPWNWLVCSIESPPRVTQINITSTGANGTIPIGFGNLDRLAVLDLSNNSFTGELPQSLASVSTLRELNVANNKLNGELPQTLPKSSLLNLEILSLHNNNFSGNPSSLFVAFGPAALITKIDLSNNDFSGPLPAEIVQLANLQYLDLSFNNLTNSKGDNTIARLIASSNQLKFLNLRSNSFTGTIPSAIWTSESLETVDLSDNKFDTLNLTTWCSILQSRNGDLSGFKQKVNLTNNAIKNVIYPCADYVNKLPKPGNTDSWIQLHLVSSGYILLANNGYCDENGNNGLANRYVCRPSQTHNFWDTSARDNRKVIIIASVVCGVFVIVVACILFVLSRRMWRRTKELRKIQEALAREDVRPPFFKYDVLKTATGDFSEVNKLGEGAFGAVYKAVLPDHSIVAVKVLEPTDQNIEDFLNEMVLITGIKHKHLIQLKGCCVRDRKRLLVYEYAENKNLADALWGPERTFGLSWDQRFKICMGVAKGLSYLHEELQPRIIHRDIKAPNILLDKNLEAKIADFGLALPIREQSTPGQTQVATRIGGTLGYFSPEYATAGKVTEKLDVYSYGVLVLEIIAGRKCIDLSLTDPDEIYLKDWAFKKYTDGRVMDIVETALLATGSIDQILLVLKTAISCLQENHERRPSMSQVVNMLSGRSPDEVAVDIIGQLKDQERMYQDLFQASKGKGTEDSLAEHGLLQSTGMTQSSEGPQSLIHLSVTKPR